MPKLSHALLAASLAAVAAGGNATAADADQEEPMTATAAAPDQYQWLEDVLGEKQLDWVRAQNTKAEAELASTAQFKQLEADIRAILDSDAKIPGVEKIGDYYYNFWKDKQHERGLWRRTTLAEYRKPKPQWETVIDLDALNKAEDKQWVWHGADCLKPAYTRCLIALSPGGSDADVTREFDLTTKTLGGERLLPPRSQGRAGLDRPGHGLRLHRFRSGHDDQLRLPEHRQAMDARYADQRGDAGVRRQARRHVHRRAA
jgi:prolyl oligopeptidase